VTLSPSPPEISQQRWNPTGITETALPLRSLVAAQRKSKTHLTLQERQEFRHNKNFCYPYSDPVADSYAKLIPIHVCLTAGKEKKV